MNIIAKKNGCDLFNRSRFFIEKKSSPSPCSFNNNLYLCEI